MVLIFRNNKQENKPENRSTFFSENLPQSVWGYADVELAVTNVSLISETVNSKNNMMISLKLNYSQDLVVKS